MIPPAFDYVRPSSVDEAVAALAAGDEAKVLAGGQSLLPLLRLRLSFPSVLVDLGRLNELRGVREEAGELVVGAMTTHAEVASSDLVRSRCGLLAAAAATIGDPAVRHRGTFGGSLAHADPAGDLPAIAVALDATLVAAGPSGRRSIPARDFFADYLSTALQPDEVLVEVRVPVLGEGWGYRYEKFRRVVQAWTIWAWPRRSVALTVRSPRPESVWPTWVRHRSGRLRWSRHWPGWQCRTPRRSAAQPTRPPSARPHRATCTPSPTTGSTWPAR
jgi:aerobic carbon-monoxide dehydrogenase medium subunit